MVNKTQNMTYYSSHFLYPQYLLQEGFWAPRVYGKGEGAAVGEGKISKTADT